jgi:hypothetical protein
MDVLFHLIEQYRRIGLRRAGSVGWSPSSYPPPPPENASSNDRAHWDGLPISLGWLARSRSMITPIIPSWLHMLMKRFDASGSAY